MVELLVLGLALGVMLSVLWGTVRTGISPMPSSAHAREAMLGLLPESVEGSILELGSGWGGMACCLAKRHPQAPVEGYELSVVPWVFSALRQRASGLKNLSVHRADFRSADFSGASVLVCYLHPEGMKRLAEALEERLPPGLVLISNTFALPGFEPQEVLVLDDLYSTRIYSYVGREAEA
ncbi:MAG: class I SAM-dependent methyltransferase [Myxococcota bacterium]|nr:class I SAM-dependent methyltransferase [Myxococcota bacterium]